MTTSLLTSTTTPDTDLDLALDLDLNAATDTNDPRITAEVEQVIDRLEALASEQENLQAQLAVLRDERDRLILRGLAYGMSSSELATRARLTGARVRAIADAAEAVVATRDLQSQRGRASWLQDRSIGLQDPGATAFLRALEAWRDASTGERGPRAAVVENL